MKLTWYEPDDTSHVIHDSVNGAAVAAGVGAGRGGGDVHNYYNLNYEGNYYDSPPLKPQDAMNEIRVASTLRR